MSKFLTIFLTLALASGFAESYKLSLSSAVTNGAKSLPAGDYKVEVKDGTAVFKKGKEVVEFPVTVEESATKYRDTQIGTVGSTLKQINLGGTTMKLIFAAAPTTANAGGQ